MSDEINNKGAPVTNARNYYKGKQDNGLFHDITEYEIKCRINSYRFLGHTEPDMTNTRFYITLLNDNFDQVMDMVFDMLVDSYDYEFEAGRESLLCNMVYASVVSIDKDGIEHDYLCLEGVNPIYEFTPDDNEIVLDVLRNSDFEKQKERIQGQADITHYEINDESFELTVLPRYVEWTDNFLLPGTEEKTCILSGGECLVGKPKYSFFEEAKFRLPPERMYIIGFTCDAIFKSFRNSEKIVMTGVWCRHDTRPPFFLVKSMRNFT